MLDFGKAAYSIEVLIEFAGKQVDISQKQYEAEKMFPL